MRMYILIIISKLQYSKSALKYDKHVRKHRYNLYKPHQMIKCPKFIFINFSLNANQEHYEMNDDVRVD